MTEQDEKPEAVAPSAHWLDKIREGQKAFETYNAKCKAIEKQYGSLKDLAEAAGDREFQIFWANLEVLKPTIYQRPPQPVVMPRHSDTGEVVRKASEMLERVLEVDVELDDLHDTLVLVRDDLAICGRGVPWVLDNGHAEHLDREDFVHEPCRKWSECGWVARRAYLSREDGVERFGDAFYSAQLDAMGQDREDNYKPKEKKAQVWEIWSKKDRAVFWVTEGVDEVLDQSEPMFEVKGFFPCPKPAYGTVERGTLKPIPDYVYYRDQIDEINELTARISALAESLRLKGFYSAGASEVGEAVQTAMANTDNKAILVPISAFAQLGGGNAKDAIVWLPVGDVAQVIASCVELRRQLIDDVYQITGLSDIMRGSTDPRETKGAQDLKAQYGSIRVRERQGEMVRIALDLLRIKAEIYAEKADIGTLVEMSGMSKLPTAALVQEAMRFAAMGGQGMQPPPVVAEILERAQESGEPLQQMVTVEAIDQLLKAQRIRPFLMKVETDSTIAPNEEAEKQSRIEFIGAIGGFIQQAGQMVAAQPETAPFAAELMKFAAGGFRAGRDLGGAIDQFAEQVKKKAAQATEQPNPEAMAAQMEAQQRQAEFELRAQEIQAKQAMQAEELRLRMVEAQSRAMTEMVNANLKAREMNLKEEDMDLKERQAELDALFKVEEIDIERDQKRAAQIGEG